jgi:flagellar biosynthetic protein FliR
MTVITIEQVSVFFMIFARLMGMMIMAPMFARKEVFAFVKVVLVFMTSGLIMFVIPLPAKAPETAIQFLLVMMVEIFMGMALGFLMEHIIIALEFAGSLMDTQAGLSVASILDPSSGHNITLLSLLLNWSAIILFIQVNGHHLILTALVDSFHIIPPGSEFHMEHGLEFLMHTGYEVFELGVKVAMPIILIVFMIDFAFGMLNKVAEQVNVFQLGFQVKPVVSILILLAFAPSLVENVVKIIELIAKNVLILLHYFSV